MRVVLVEPRDSRNVGAVARAMANLGFADLHLVAPRGYDREQAGVTARNASPILDTAAIHERLDDAVSDVRDVVGLALRTGPSPARCVTLPEWAAIRANVPTALVFGPEDDDLRHEHLDLCRWIVRIPSRAAYPSFNLAQSVLVTLYEIARTPVPDAPAPPADLPTAGDMAQLDRLVREAMEASGFTRPGAPTGAARTVGTLLRRMDLDRTEAAALMALFGRIGTSLRRPPTGE